MILAQVNDSLAVMISIFVLILVCGIGFLIYYLIKKEQKRYHEEVNNFIDGIDSKNEIIADINAFIAKFPSTDFALLHFDIDKFSSIVENIGEEEGNQVIKELITKINRLTPNKIIIGRIDRDKFIFFDRGELTRDDVSRFAKNILKVVSEPITLFDDSVITLTASIGVCFYPIHGSNYKDLFKSLEMASYICKRKGGNQYCVYSKDMNQDGSNPEYYVQIKNGIKNKEFDLYYQPIINGIDNSIYAIEGLLRWNHPELGLLSPYKFINLMEQTGDINWVGLWGLEVLVKEFIELQKVYNHEFKMSFNLSPKQLANPQLPFEFQKIIRKYRVQARQIICEIDEFALFERQEVIQKTLQQLSDFGFEIAIDGFGLDYKALKKLETSPINIVKLDKDCLNEQEDFLKAKFIEMLIDFARQNNRILVCEGVENNEYLAKAKEMGIQYFQGYHFAKPLNSTEIASYITSGDWVRGEGDSKNKALDVSEDKKEDETKALESESLEVNEEVGETKDEEVLTKENDDEEVVEEITESIDEMVPNTFDATENVVTDNNEVNQEEFVSDIVENNEDVVDSKEAKAKRTTKPKTSSEKKTTTKKSKTVEVTIPDIKE